MEKKEILKKFFISTQHGELLQKYIDTLIKNNLLTNLVGKSTLINPWNSHILDSIQILSFIKDRNYSILDMGTGAGLPGVVLAIAGCKNVSLLDSNAKKINFLKNVKKETNLDVKLILSRIENINNSKYDIITCRALARLDKLFSYSQRFVKKNTVLIFLKGKNVNEEIIHAKKNWKFILQKHTSLSDSRGSVIVVKDIKKK